jgi:hypothetical protein
MQSIALAFLAALLYSMAMMVYWPFKLLWLKRSSRSAWTYFSRSRLAVSGLAFLVASPGPGAIAFLISAASVSGSHSVTTPDWMEAFGWAFFFVWLAMAIVLLGLAILRPARMKAAKSGSPEKQSESSGS